MAGRPSENPKHSRVTIRLTDNEKICLIKYASSQNMTMTEVVASAVRNFLAQANADTLSFKGKESYGLEEG